ncbi:MAG: hypothetical protein BWZ04_02605 [Firmicutes bacterium ADurb.BinA205]|nr:MAG: hypothetical protein BWZ04_02605 [Firmicutes bacterium ADurb.BinA205]HOC34137.1 hypothetical protein [Ruminococcus flavefaciens]HQM00379.1 hypothetical protein [Ruminococcus flavefaciens]
MDKKNFDENKVNALLGAVSKKIGVSSDQLRKELAEGKFDSALASMNKNDASKLQRVMNDPKLIEKMMSTPQAQALYKKLSGK